MRETGRGVGENIKWSPLALSAEPSAGLYLRTLKIMSRAKTKSSLDALLTEPPRHPQSTSVKTFVSKTIWVDTITLLLDFIVFLKILCLALMPGLLADQWDAFLNPWLSNYRVSVIFFLKKYFVLVYKYWNISTLCYLQLSSYPFPFGQSGLGSWLLRCGI